MARITGDPVIMPKQTSESKSPSITFGRRQWWRQALGMAVVTGEELYGHRHFALSELAGLPDECLEKIVPIFREDGGFRLDNGRLVSAADDPENRRCICECSPQESCILARFGGNASLGEIGREVAGKFGISQHEGFMLVRELFLRLAQEVICHPAEPEV
jgi:hypothetical protein